ncbi:MAG: DegV family protein [Symbiobacteriia bacterium]
MTKPVRILCDTCCDLPRDLLDQRGIKAIPLTLILGDQLLRDGIDITAAEFYARVQQEGIAPTTSQVTPAEYLPFFTEAVEGGSEAVYIGLSSGLSGSVQSAFLAARTPALGGRVQVVDSLGASVGLGLMVLKAADLADAGKSAAEIKAAIDEYRAGIHHVFTLDTLEFARRSGRVTRFSSIAAGVLDIKPVLNMDMQGHLVPFGKVRGRKKALGRLFEEMDRLGANPAGTRVGISHGHDLATATEMAERFRSQYGAAEVVVGEIGAIIGAHVGPGCISIFFEGPTGRGY